MERTLFIIKPDGVERKLIGDIIKIVENAGLDIINMRMVHLSWDNAEQFYSIHRGKPFFSELIDYVTRGRIVVMELAGENSIEKTRTLIGKTNPKEAREGTIRAIYGLSNTENTVHASDSKKTAEKEIKFFFFKKSHE